MVPQFPTIRSKVLVAVLAMAALPPLLVFLSSWHESGVGRRMEVNVSEAAREAAALLEREGDAARLAAKIDALALRRDLWIRVVRDDGSVAAEADHEAATGLLQLTSDIFFGDDGAPTLREHDATLPPLAQRPALVAARERGEHHGCQRTPERKLLVCQAARRVVRDAGGAPALVLAQESSRRDIRALYDLRYQLLKLTLVVIPLGVLIALWLGWRLVRPVERLRAEVLLRARAGEPRAGVDLGRRDEVGDLARAFDDLLRTLAERGRANEAFLADLAHEFKNPVAALRACAEQLQEGGAVDAARAQRLGDVMRRSCVRLDGLVTQLLELARAEAGLPDEEREGVDLGALAAGVVDSMQAAAGEARVALALDAPAEGVVVQAVPLRVESVLRNLLDNAISFAGEGGRVDVSVALRGAEALLRVRDSGPGIAAADLPRVFDRFFTTRRERRGAGLGLALCKAIVEAHGGWIEAQSPAGAGAEITVTLPRGRAAGPRQG